MTWHRFCFTVICSECHWSHVTFLGNLSIDNQKLQILRNSLGRSARSYQPLRNHMFERCSYTQTQEVLIRRNFYFPYLEKVPGAKDVPVQ